MASVNLIQPQQACPFRQVPDGPLAGPWGYLAEFDAKHASPPP